MSMTDNQASIIDEDTFTVRRTIRIGAPIEKVWAAVTEPEHISKWFGHATFDGSGVGARGTLNWADGRGDVPIRVEAMDAPRMISYRWSNDDDGLVPAEVDEEHSTVFTFTLESVSNGTQLTVVETGFETTSDPTANLESHRAGWDGELDKLVALLEAGS